MFALIQRGGCGKRSFQEEEAELTLIFLAALTFFSHTRMCLFHADAGFQSGEEAGVCKQSLNIKGGEGPRLPAQCCKTGEQRAVVAQ